jgi:prepilin-type N-terminal cleavage/methylation domain-containing protein
MRLSNDYSNGFTLIELLIVVAIIVILASIAVANFLEAQVRSKVSRVKADLSTIATGLESYRVDNNTYPPTPLNALSDRYLRLMPLTTPTAYLSSIPVEAFSGKHSEQPAYPYWSARLTDAFKTAPDPNVFYYLPEEARRLGRWTLISRGPDRDYELALDEGGAGQLENYDPTNGSTSNGDVMRFGP